MPIQGHRMAVRLTTGEKEVLAGRVEQQASSQIWHRALWWPTPTPLRSPKFNNLQSLCLVAPGF